MGGCQYGVLAVEIPVVTGVLHSLEAGLLQREVSQGLASQINLELLFLLFAIFFDHGRRQWGL